MKTMFRKIWMMHRDWNFYSFVIVYLMWITAPLVSFFSGRTGQVYDVYVFISGAIFVFVLCFAPQQTDELIPKWQAWLCLALFLIVTLLLADVTLAPRMPIRDLRQAGNVLAVVHLIAIWHIAALGAKTMAMNH